MGDVAVWALLVLAIFGVSFWLWMNPQRIAEPDMEAVNFHRILLTLTTLAVTLFTASFFLGMWIELALRGGS